MKKIWTSIFLIFLTCLALSGCGAHPVGSSDDYGGGGPGGYAGTGGMGGSGR
ncbi:hypothetical protein [Legionella jordanis]|uniref:hypothetical protein n=1 Tax=Legionella jordanis TaxID=456 RepID=UPI00160522DB|nr:hypothetical protein [Legionella jordanis]